MTAVDIFLVGYHFTTHCKYAILTLGSDYRLGIPLITPISQSWSESTQVLTCSSVVEIDLESPKQYYNWILKSKFHEIEIILTVLAPYPASMFDATGMMRMATKSTLNNEILWETNHCYL